MTFQTPLIGAVAACTAGAFLSTFNKVLTSYNKAMIADDAYWNCEKMFIDVIKDSTKTATYTLSDMTQRVISPMSINEVYYPNGDPCAYPSQWRDEEWDRFGSALVPFLAVTAFTALAITVGCCWMACNRRARQQ